MKPRSIIVQEIGNEATRIRRFIASGTRTVPVDVQVNSQQLEGTSKGLRERAVALVEEADKIDAFLAYIMRCEEGVQAGEGCPEIPESLIGGRGEQ